MSTPVVRGGRASLTLRAVNTRSTSPTPGRGRAPGTSGRSRRTGSTPRTAPAGRLRTRLVAVVGLLAALVPVAAVIAPTPASAVENYSAVHVSGSNGWLAASIGASQERDNGYMHTCTVTSTGGVKCSGHLQYGEGGNGITDDYVPYPTNVKLTGTSPVAKTDTTAGPTIASTNRNSCVIYNATGVTGGVQCWGQNNRGMLGDGSTTQRTLPVVATKASDSTALTGVTAISGNAEDDSTGVYCALKNGGVYCWGYGGNGRLGNGGTSDSSRAVVAIAEGSNVTSVSVGSAHACAVLNGGASGTVKCWGWNGYGQLGDTTTTERTAPVTVVGTGGTGTLTGAVQVSLGGWHSCARMNDGTVDCWGHNGQGQLGTNSTTDSSKPVVVVGVGAVGTLGGVTLLGAGARHTCVIVTGGESRCWGRNASGEDGISSTADPQKAPVKVVGAGQGAGSSTLLTGLSSNPGSLSAGTFYTCWRKTDGTMLCAGYNPQGNNGNGTFDQTTSPTYVNGASPGLWSAAAIATGRIHDSTGTHSCVVTTAKQVKCWGWGGQGQMGNNTTTGVNRAPSIVSLSTAEGSSPVASTSVSGGSPISAGSTSSCVIVNTASISGGLQCWGYNGNGQLGDGTTTQRNVPTPVKAGTGPSTTVSGTAYLSGVTAVASSAWGSPTDVQHTCALANGGVFCWGWNANGQLGNNTTTQSTTPVQAIATGSGVTSIATGDETSCAVFSTGLSKCWGWNANGQLADGTTTSRSVPTSTLGSNITTVSMGAFSQCVINTSQNVYCAGYNGNGEVGDNTTTQRNGYALVVGTGGSGSLNGATSVSAGLRNACAVAGGTVYCWGRDEWGKLGKGTTDVETHFPKAALGLGEVNGSTPAAPAITGASTEANGVLGTGAQNTCVRMASGAVTCWGRDNDGELGAGQLVSNNTTISAAASPAANANGWNNSNITVTFTCSSSATVSCPSPTVLSTEGASLSASGTAVDSSGFDASTTISGLKLDKTNPTGSGSATSSPNGAGWYKNDVSVNWTCADALSGVASCPSSSTITGEGAALTASSTVTDNASNSAGLTSPAVKIDRTAPSTSISAIPTWSTSNVTVTLTPADNLSGVTGTSYKVDGGSAQSGTSVAITTDGIHTLTYASTDGAGNVESTKTATVRVDKTAPTISAAKSPLPNAGGWNASDVTVTFTCSDGTSGVASCTAPSTVTTDTASQIVGGTAVDVAGNAASTSATVKLDKTAPTISGGRSPEANAQGWNNTDVTVSFSCNDATSGIASCPAPTTLTSNGAGQSVAGSATDAAGNSSPALVAGINIDKTAPTISASVSGTPNAAGYRVPPVTVHFTCADALSGVAADSCPTDVVLTGAGTYDVDGTVSDDAGNSALTSVTVKVAGPVPTISGDRTPAANPNGWNNEPVTVTFTCGSDALASCTSPVTVNTDGAGQSVPGTATDNYGQSTSTSVTGISIDRVAPSLAGVATTPPNAAGWYHAPVDMAWTCDDVLSGISAGVCPAPTPTVGEGTAVSVTESVNDKAGNLTTATSESVQIDLTPPSTGVSSPPTWSNSDVTLTLTATDGLSGVDASYSKVDGAPAQPGIHPVVSGQGHHTVEYWSTDVAGNAETHATATVDIDTSAPSITSHVSPAPNANGWHKGNVDVTFTCSDTASGVATCTGDASFANQVDTVVTGHASDNAGNTATDQATVRIDLTAPTVTAQVPPANVHGWFNAPVQVPFSCSDTGGSGVGSCPVPVVFGGEGAAQPVTGTGTDNAGNEGSASGSTVSLDLTPPVISGVTVQPTNGSGGYYGTVTVHWTCSDALSGIVSCPSDQTVSGEGVHTVPGSVNDKAGNTSSTEVSFRIDHDPATDPGIVHGVITDAVTGQPVKNALVGLAKATVQLTTMYSVRTGTDGSYTIPIVADGSYKLFVNDYGTHLQAWYPNKPNDVQAPTLVFAHGTNLTANQALTPGYVLEGTLRASASGAPISGATVRVQGGGVDYSAISDATGRYAVTGMVAGSRTVSIYGYGVNPMSFAASFPGPIPGDRVLTTATTSPGIKGTITAFSPSAPLGGAIVSVFLKNGFTIAVQATTGANGRFTLPAMPSGDYEVNVTRGDYQIRWYGDSLSRPGAATAALNAGCTSIPDPTWGDACARPVNITMRRPGQ